MPYQPTTGDRVRVTRKTPDGHTTTSTGTLGEVDNVHGFSLHGDDNTHSWYSDAATLLRCYGVIQTIEPKPDTS